MFQDLWETLYSQVLYKGYACLLFSKHALTNEQYYSGHLSFRQLNWPSRRTHISFDVVSFLFRVLWLSHTLATIFQFQGWVVFM